MGEIVRDASGSGASWTSYRRRALLLRMLLFVFLLGPIIVFAASAIRGATGIDFTMAWFKPRGAVVTGGLAILAGLFSFAAWRVRQRMPELPPARDGVGSKVFRTMVVLGGFRFLDAGFRILVSGGANTYYVYGIAVSNPYGSWAILMAGLTMEVAAIVWDWRTRLVLSSAP